MQGEIAELAMTAADAGAFREALFALLGRSIGFDKVSMHATFADGASRTDARGWDDPRRFEALPSCMGEFTAAEIAAASTGRPVVDLEALSGRRRDELSLYQRILRPEQVRVYATMMWRSHAGAAGLSLARTGRSARFTAREVRRLEELLPALQLADAVVSLRERKPEEPSFAAWADDAGLSAREREIAALVVRGLTNGEVAALLRVSPNTVRNQLAAVFRKADVSTRAELAYLATSFTAAAPGRTPRWLEYVR